MKPLHEVTCGSAIRVLTTTTCWLMFSLMVAPIGAQIRPPNQDESKVPPYSVPDCLVGRDGKRITKPEQWSEHRSYLIEQLTQHEYGSYPQSKAQVSFTTVEEGLMADNKTLRRQLRVVIAGPQPKSGSAAEVKVDLILFLPKDASKGVPCFLGLNFRGNHAMSDDPKILMPVTWVPDDKKTTKGNEASELGRNQAAHRWPISEITSRGYGVASAYYGDIDPDFDDGFKNGVHALFPDHVPDEQHPDRWGSIAAWAWGLHRMADVLLQQKEIRPDGLMVVGHSRLGKAALWAGATDTRFRIVYSNNSGCGGAALSKRVFGESVARINTSFPHWFCRNFRQYNDKEESLPVEQNMLIASIAPRPVYIASATEDLWADPIGEYLSGWYASEAYRLLGLEGLPEKEMPAPDKVVGGSVGFHLRIGKHDILAYDWQKFMDFADRHLK